MALVDGILQPGYTVKSMIKLLLFLVLPLVLARILKIPFRNAFRPDRKALCGGGVLGIATLGVILAAYHFLHPYVDLSTVPAALEEGAGVTPDNFLFVSTYIALCNSLLEEFYFRCFSFLGLLHTAPKAFAYIFSAAAFAVYHAGMLVSMVSFQLFLLALLALFLCGFMFNFFNSLQERIWISWFVHMGANLAINIIGMHLLGML